MRINVEHYLLYIVESKGQGNGIAFLSSLNIITAIFFSVSPLENE